MTTCFTYLIGIDGGGTGTRALLATPDGIELARGQAGPSGLALGVEAAWSAIQMAVNDAFFRLKIPCPEHRQIALGCGLAGVNNPQWSAKFIALNPGFGALALETDARTNVLGAHGGAAGAMIALGTGSVAEVMLPDGSRREVGGWGFPAGDEASGAWLGWRAISHALRVLDGRAVADAFSDDVLAFCSQGAVHKEELNHGAAALDWLAHANSTRFAQLAPLVLRHAEQGAARDIMLAAGREVALMVHALDPSGTLPIALCGGLAAPTWPFLPAELRERFVKPQGDAVSGALRLIINHLQQAHLQ